MAVRVIDPGPDPSVVKQIVCRHCGAKLEYVPNDVQSRYVKDISGCSDEERWIDCPQCMMDVHL